MCWNQNPRFAERIFSFSHFSPVSIRCVQRLRSFCRTCRSHCFPVTSRYLIHNAPFALCLVECARNLKTTTGLQSFAQPTTLFLWGNFVGFRNSNLTEMQHTTDSQMLDDPNCFRVDKWIKGKSLFRQKKRFRKISENVLISLYCSGVLVLVLARQHTWLAYDILSEITRSHIKWTYWQILF